MRIRLYNAAGTPAAQEPATMHESIIVYGPPGCGKTLNAVVLARHFGLARILDDQDPHALPPGVATDTLLLTSVDLRGRTELAGCRVLSYQEAATEAGVFAPVCQCTGD
jgi:ATPase related to the helicase subunit of the Holliday junction resolvase